VIFSTTLFLFLFLPVFLVVYYAIPFRLRSGWILIGSWFFYGWWRFDFLGLMIATTIWTYGLGNMVVRNRVKRLPYARLYLVLGIVLNLGVLGYFKYFNFAMDSFNALLAGLGFQTFTFIKIILPIGISFYIFQAISYLIDLYRGDAVQAADYIQFAAYISLFPQLVAGPILRYKQVAEQLHEREHTFNKFSEGAARFMAGFCKKVLIADTVAVLVQAVFSLEQPGFPEAWLGALAYTVQLYFDFCGYSDMAIGLGLMLGFRFMENFDRPYLSKSITEFWRRWHISLSSWLRDYLYIPLGGNRKSASRTYLNIALVMLLGGLWHGAAWTFAAWGAWHGSFLILERLTMKNKFFIKLGRQLPKPVSLLWTLMIVMIGWVVFRAPDFQSALAMYAGMAGLHGFALADEFAWQISNLALVVLLIGWILIFVEGRWIYWFRKWEFRKRVFRKRVPQWSPLFSYNPYLLIPCFVLSILKLSAESFSPFLYFQF
jgi:alginate O-acetyltransferase complex protein AlgI